MQFPFDHARTIVGWALGDAEMASIAVSVGRNAAKRNAIDGVKTILRLEGAVLLLAAVGFYARFGSGWALFAMLFLTPDLSFTFYLFGTRLGAAAYNIAHSTIGPLALAFAWLLFAQPLVLSLAAIWLAHIGFDHALGYGLKYADAFAHTHLGWIGKGNQRIANSE